MRESFKQTLRENGVTLDEALTRFMDNEDIYERFLYKFLNDKNFEQLKACYRKGDYDEAFRHAHTLKGVMANLGLMAPYEDLEIFVESIRGGTADANAEQSYAAFCEKFTKLMNVIRSKRDE